MKHRKIIVEFKTPAGDKRLDGIEVKFSVDKLMSAVMNKASVDICNLAQEDIEYLTTYTSQFIAINERKRIRIFAGYEEDGVSLIFDGDVVEGMPTNPPDRWIRMKALSGYYTNKEPVSKTLNGDLSVQEVCSEAANLLGVPMIFEATSVKKISDFSFTGDKRKILKDLNELGDITAYEDDGVLMVVDKDKPRNSLEVRYIDENSGLIGVPKPDPLGIECTVLLDNSLKIGQQIYIESKIFPSASGLYYIYELKHSGDLRGQEFYTQIKARRFNSVTS